MDIILHAASGLKDQEIAKALGIRPATVSSYWARVREKLGPVSRTALVGMVIRQQLVAELSAIQEENAALRAARRMSSSDSHATLLVDQLGQIADCNKLAEDLFGYPEDRLIGARVTLTLESGSVVQPHGPER